MFLFEFFETSFLSRLENEITITGKILQERMKENDGFSERQRKGLIYWSISGRSTDENR